MPLYQYAWLILLSPLFACTVIVFGTRMWDLFARRRVTAPEGHAEAGGDVSFFQAPGPHGETLTFEDDEDPKVPRLTTGAKISGYLGILIMALACLYSWVLLLNTAGVLSIARPLPPGGMTVLSYDWLVQGTAYRPGEPFPSGGSRVICRSNND